MSLPIRTVRLATDPSQNGLYCGPDGVTLGGIPLLRETASGFLPHDPFNLQHLFDMAYGAGAIDASRYARRLAHVANALNKGDLPLAMIGGLLLKLPDVSTKTGKLPKPAGEFGPKQAFDEDQPRDADGKWTTGPAGEARQTPLAVPAPEAANPPEESPIARIGPRLIGLLGRLAVAIADAIPLAIGLILIPTNASNIHEGSFPGFPTLGYRSDEGMLTISRLDPAGQIEVLYRGAPDANDFYHDDQGNIIGRHVGTGILFDSNALTELAAKPTNGKEPETGIALLPNASASQDDKEPKVCPPPTEEDTTGRSDRAIAYQTQITGLPKGYDVLFNGVRYDGCDKITKFMQEAKGLMGGYLTSLPEDRLRQEKFYRDTMDQARRQNDAAIDRGVDWYFADQKFADFFEIEFRNAGYARIDVHYREAVLKKIEDCIIFAIKYLDEWLKKQKELLLDLS
jgi:hypothetical protein